MDKGIGNQRHLILWGFIFGIVGREIFNIIGSDGQLVLTWLGLSCLTLQATILDCQLLSGLYLIKAIPISHHSCHIFCNVILGFCDKLIPNINRDRRCILRMWP